MASPIMNHSAQPSHLSNTPVLHLFNHLFADLTLLFRFPLQLMDSPFKDQINFDHADSKN